MENNKGVMAYSFRAKFAAKCERCGEAINPGDKILWVRGGKRWHEPCFGQAATVVVPSSERHRASTRVETKSTQVETAPGWTSFDTSVED